MGNKSGKEEEVNDSAVTGSASALSASTGKPKTALEEKYGKDIVKLKASQQQVREEKNQARLSDADAVTVDMGTEQASSDDPPNDSEHPKDQPADEASGTVDFRGSMDNEGFVTRWVNKFDVVVPGGKSGPGVMDAYDFENEVLNACLVQHEQDMIDEGMKNTDKEFKRRADQYKEDWLTVVQYIAPHSAIVNAQSGGIKKDEFQALLEDFTGHKRNENFKPGQAKPKSGGSGEHEWISSEGFLHARASLIRESQREGANYSPNDEWEKWKKVDADRCGELDKMEFSALCQDDLFDKMDKTGEGKLGADEYVRFLRILHMGEQDIDPKGCIPRCLAKPDGVWAPLSFHDFVVSQHTVLMIFYGTGRRADTSRIWHRIGFLILTMTFNLAANAIATVEAGKDNAGTVILFVTVLDVVMVGFLRALFLEVFSSGWGDTSHNVWVAFLSLMVVTAVALIIYAFATASSSLTNQFMLTWITSWSLARLSELFKLGFQWGLRKEHGGYQGLC